MATIPAKTKSIDFEHGGFQNVGTMCDLRNIYDAEDPGHIYAVSRPVIYNEFAAKHLLSDDVHSSRLAWIKSNESDFVRAIEKPEFVEKTLRLRRDGFYSGTHIVKVSNSTSSSDEYMVVAITYTQNPDQENSFHQITTIHPKRKREIFTFTGELRDKYLLVKS